jgi:hypothetical protein
VVALPFIYNARPIHHHRPWRLSAIRYGFSHEAILPSEIRHAITYIPSCDVARSVRGERLQRVREGDHGVLRDESAAVKKQIALFSLGIIEGHGCVAHTRSQPSATERTLSSLFGNLDGLRGVSSAFRAVTSGIAVARRRNLDTRRTCCSAATSSVSTRARARRAAKMLRLCRTGVR